MSRFGNLFSSLVGVAFLVGSTFAFVPSGDPEAVRECGNIHDIDMHQFDKSHAEFIHEECALNCTVDGRALNTVSINEGYICPRNAHGLCKRGICKPKVNLHHHGDAVVQCGNLNHVDTTLFNNSGTHYSNAECKVYCYINGQEASEHNINEGYQCPQNENGACKGGDCLESATVSPPLTTKLPPAPTTTPKPPTTHPVTAVTPPWVDTPDNTEVERISAKFVGGQLSTDHSAVTNISVCYKSVSVRTFDRNACKYYCSSTEISCIIQSPENAFPRESYFLFNVWKNGNSVGDSFLSVVELFTVVRDDPSMMVAHNGKNNYNMNALTSLTLYNNVPVVGNFTVEFDLTYRRKGV